MKSILRLLTLLLAYAALGPPRTALAQTCTTATTTVVYGNRTAGEDWKAHAQVGVPDAAGATRVSTGGYVPTSTTTSTLAIGTLNGATMLWTNDFSATTGNTTVTFTFNRPLSNFTVNVQDIDASRNSPVLFGIGNDGDPNYTDQVAFAGANAGTAVVPTLSSTAGTTLVLLTPGTATVPAYATGVDDNNANTSALVTATFPSPITTLTLTYRNGSGLANPDVQAVGIDQMTWCRVVPVANNVTNSTTLPTNAGQVTIDNLSSTVDGTVQRYNVTAIPPAAQGVLYYNSTGSTYAAVANGQALTPAQAASLRFAPAAGATGSSATFSYTVRDDANLTSAAAATFTIPLQVVTPCVATATLDFSTTGATGEDWKNHAAVSVPAGSSQTQVTTGGYTVDAASSANSTFVIGTQTTGNTIKWNNNYANGSPKTSSVTFTFTRPVSNFTVRVEDIDAGPNYLDQVVFTGKNGAATVTPSLSPVDPNQVYFTISGNTATGIAGQANNNTRDGASVIAYFPSPITTLTLTYNNAAAGATSASQAVGIDLLNFCRLAPVANPVASTVSDAATKAAVGSLTSQVDGTVASYSFTSVPTAAQGTLFLGNTAVTTGTVITAAQASQLTFTPAAGSSGTFNVSYTVKDDGGQVSPTATYAITVNASGAAGTPAACASPGKDGSPTGLTTNPNTYYPSTAAQTLAVGTTSITVGAATGTGNIAVGDLLLVIQMQGADIDATNTDSYGDGVAGGGANGNLNTNFTAGTYEYVVANSAITTTGGTITLATALKNGYVNAAATTTAGQRRFQVVRVPQFGNLTLGGNITPTPWNGSVGGIIAIDVAKQTNLNGFKIDASGAGFRGGGGRKLSGNNTATGTDYRFFSGNDNQVTSAHGSKGEGTAGTPKYVNILNGAGTDDLNTGSDYPNGSNGRGAPGNAGGGGTDNLGSTNNSENSGGAGGANGGAGGRGGNTWNTNLAIGGEPGAAFAVASSSRLVLGGGGGAGSTNDGSGTPNNGFASSGATGGGLVMLRTGTVSGTGSILANGANANNTVANDGSGGGGAGGSILVTATTPAGLANLTLTANGGTGGTNTGNGVPHGPGGGGGGGVILTNGSTMAASAAAGAAAGTTNGGTSFGAVAGLIGDTNAQISNSVANSVSGATCFADVTTTITGPATLSVGQPAGSSIYTATFTNTGSGTAANVTQTVTLPAGATVTAANLPAGATTSTTGSGATAVTTVNFGTALTLANGASNTFSFSFTAPATAGSYPLTSNVATDANQGADTAPNMATLTIQVNNAPANCGKSYYDGTNTYSGLSAFYYQGDYTNNPAFFNGKTPTDKGIASTINYSRTVANTGGTFPITSATVNATNNAFSAQYKGNVYITTAGSYTFSLSNPAVGVLDDRAQLYLDGKAVPASGTPATGDASINVPSYNANTATVTLNLSSGTHNILLQYGAAGQPDRVSLSYSGPDSPTLTVIPNSVLCAGLGNIPPIALNGTNANIPNNAGPTTLSPSLTGTDQDGNVVKYAIATLPLASQGTLRLNGTAVTAGQVITAAQAAQLTFQPVSTFSGNASFTFSAIDDSAINNNAGQYSNDVATYTIPVTAAADLTTALTGPATVVPGQPTGTYTATFTNEGPSAASAVTRTVTLPASATNVVVPNGATLSTTGGVTTINFGTATTVASGASSSFNFSFTPAATATGTLAVTSNVTTTTSQGTNIAPDASTITATVAPTADVATTIAANTTPVAAGTPATATNPAKFTVTFSNSGPAQADNVTGTVQLPAGLTGVIVSASNGITGTYNSATGVVTYSGATAIPSGGSLTSTIAFDAPVTGPVVATSLISTTTNEAGKQANNTASATIAIAPTFDLTTTLSGPVSAVPGDLVTLAVTTTNTSNSPSAAPNAVQTVLLPQGLTNVYVSNGGVYNGASTAKDITVNGVTYTNVQPGQVVFPTIGSLPSGQTVANSVSFSQPSASYSPSALVSTTSSGETTLNNNTAYLNGAASSTPVAVLTPAIGSGTANAYTTITSSVATTTIGSPITLTVVTGNNGPNAATGVTQTVQLLPGLTGVVISNSGTYNSTTGIVTFPTIASQASATSVSNTITFTAPASTGNNGQLLAMAAVSTTNIDPVPADNVASVGVTLAQSADLATTVTGPASAQAGQPVTYTARFVNNGTMAATNVVETVQLPAGLGANAVTITDAVTGNPVTNATYNSATGLVTFPTIATGLNGTAQAYNLTFAAPAQNLAVRSNVTSATTDATLTNNTASAPTTVSAAADLATAVAGPATAVVGSAVTYSVTTTNNGPSTAINAATTLQLAAGFTVATLQVGGQTGTLSGNIINFADGSKYDTSTGLVTFPSVASQASGATTTNYVTFVMPNAAGGQTTGVASVSSATTDPASGNNSASVATSVAPTTTTTADITASVTTTAPATGIAPGATVPFTATYGNTGPDPAVNVIPTLQLAPGLTAATITVAGQSGTLSNGLLTFTNSGAVYSQQTGLVTFPTIASQTSGAANNVSYAVNVTAPASGSVVAVAATTSNTSEPNTAAAQANDVKSVSVPVTPSFDEVASLSGLASAPVGSPVTYTVTTTNNGPSPTTGTTTQTVTLPAGVTVTNISNSGMQSGNTITWTIPAGQAVGTNGAVANTFTISQPTGGATLTANVTSPGESNTGNNSATTTTTVTNLAPLAYAVVNRLQGPQSSDAGGLPNGLLISPLAASDPENSFSNTSTVQKYTIVAAPDAATQGILYYNNGGTYVAVASGQTLTDAQAQTLKFKAATGYVGNASFTYLTTDAAGNNSPVVNYTIPVESDTEAATYTVLAPKASAYTTGDVLAYTTDVNGAVNNAGTASVYQANGTLQTGANNGVASAVLAATGPTGNPGNTLPAGVSLNPTTGQIYVSDVSATGLMNNSTARTYSVNVTTIDANGGLTTQTVTFTIKPNPLPVVLTAFTAQAVQNRDALLNWNTASEVNSASFDIERSFDGTAYAKIGEVAAQGTTTTAHAYTYTDASIAARAQGPVYYRLRQVDLNGATSYSPVRTVSFTKVTTIALSLYPNPAGASTNLDLSQLPTASTYQVLVLDATGRQVLSTTLGGGLPQALNLNGLASGTYQVLVSGTLADGSALRQVLRLIKE